MSKLKFQIYQCRTGHFHLLTSYSTPSWPFWCLGTGLQLVEFCRRHLIDHQSPDAVHEYEMLDNLKDEIKCLSRAQCVDERGRFKKGFLLSRRRPPLDEYDVAKWWGKFFSGQTGNVYVYSELLMRHIPLRCNFVDRPGDDKSLTLFRLEKLEAKPRTVRELGINLEARDHF